MMYYAGYADSALTDIAVFESEEDRDSWVVEESIFKRKPYDESEIHIIVGYNPTKVKDIFGVVWMLNQVNEAEEEFDEVIL